MERIKKIWKKVKSWVAPVGIFIGILGTAFWGVFKLRGSNSVAPRMGDTTRRVQRAEDRHQRITDNQRESAELNSRARELTTEQREYTGQTESTLKGAEQRIERIEDIITGVNRRTEQTDKSD